MDIFSLNGIWCDYHDLKVINIQNRYSIPKKQYESIEVPGRTGNLLIDTGARLNKDISIECCLNCGPLNEEQTNLKMKEITEWLIGPKGYQDLIFSDGGHFKAIVNDVVNVVHKRKDNVFVFTVIFECYEVM